jgi:hypothetical protein
MQTGNEHQYSISQQQQQQQRISKMYADLEWTPVFNLTTM